ncbi:MAG: NAD(P)/FAD-dependent oxidoreductase [Planctomycetota bacterium]
MADVCILGGGVNGLAAAATLAKAGRRVTLLEARGALGGLAAGEELAPGLSTFGDRLDAAPPVGLLDELELERHGLRWRDDVPPLLVADGEADGLLVHAEPGPMWEQLPAAEAQRYADWRSALARWTSPVRALLTERPPDLKTRAPGELFALAKHALSLRRLGDRDMHELMRVAPMAVHDWAHEIFTDARLRAAIAPRALAGTTAGPRSPGTCASLLLDEALRGREPFGGGPALVAALTACARERGAELRTDARAEEILLDADGVRGVRVAGGETVEARTVLSTADFATTMLALVDPAQLPDRMETAARVWKRRATTAVVHIALEAAPELPAAGGRPVERVSSATDLRAMERAADGPKHGRLAENSWSELRIHRPAEGSGAVVTMHVHGVPYALPEGGRETVEERALAQLERLSPGSRGRVAATRTKTPADLEREHGLAGGHLFHGEHILDQLWLQRPALSCSRYATPISGLYLGGGSVHPGGALPGGAGILAARALVSG